MRILFLTASIACKSGFYLCIKAVKVVFNFRRGRKRNFIQSTHVLFNNCLSIMTFELYPYFGNHQCAQ